MAQPEFLSLPQSFRSACDRYAASAPTRTDIAVLTALTTSTPLPPHIPPLDYGFSATTRLPEDPCPFHQYKNHARIQAHAHKTALLEKALSEALGSPPVVKKFPHTLAALPAKVSLQNALRKALSNSCYTSLTLPRAVLRNAGVEFVGAVSSAGFSVYHDSEAGKGEVMFRMVDGMGDWAIVAVLWRLRYGTADGGVRDVVPAGVVQDVGPRRGGFGRNVAKLCLLIL